MRAIVSLMLVLLLALPGSAGHAASLPAGMPLTLDFAHDLLGAALAATGAGEAFELRLDQPRLPLANQSERATEIVVEELRYEADSGRFSALLVGTIGATVRFRLPALGRAEGLAPLPVLARAVAAGEQIAAADLEWIMVAPRPAAPDQPDRGPPADRQRGAPSAGARSGADRARPAAAAAGAARARGRSWSTPGPGCSCARSASHRPTARSASWCGWSIRTASSSCRAWWSAPTRSRSAAPCRRPTAPSAMMPMMLPPRR